MTALFVARPLVPSEAVAWLGDGQPFCMLWLLLAVGTSLAAVKAGGFLRRFGWVELLVGMFVILHSLAAGRGATIGSPRPAFNMLWEGVSMGVSFLLVRQLVQSAREARAIVAVMVALAVVLSTYGLYQVFIGLPADRAEYARDPDGMLRRAGEWYTKGSPERTAFENRLNSTEPLATFALTNSLAGFLAPWMTMAAGLAVINDQRRSRQWFIALTLALACCLILTKSRSAILASALAFVFVIAPKGPPLAVAKWKVLVAMLGAIAALVTIAISVEGLDGKVVTEAGKSLGYRLQYWQSTTAMIRDWPLLGVGPGNFQDFYTEHKLPEASEEIRDPHNWVYEIAATAGLPAVVVFCVVMAISIWKLFRAKPPLGRELGAEWRAADVDRGIAVNDWYIFGGGAGGFLVALIVGPLAGLPLGFEKAAGGLIVGGAALLALRSWVREGSLSPSILAIGAAVMLVNLLVAGGIMYPAVAGSLWLLLGLGMNLVETRQSLASKSAALTAFALCAALAVSQYFTGYSPVLRSQGAMMEAQDPGVDIAGQEHALNRAAAADPRAAEPWHELAALKLRLWLDRGGPRAIGEFREASNRFLALKPHSSSAHRTVGNWLRQVPDPAEAAKHLARAVELYPNHAVLRAEVALALAEAAQTDAATREAAQALELDAATPHADKKLRPDIREKMSELAGKSRPGSR